MGGQPFQFPVEGDLGLELSHRFDYHAPVNPLVRESHEGIRAEMKRFAKELVAATPSSREQSVMLTKLEECSFWAHAAIARNHDKFPAAGDGAAVD